MKKALKWIGGGLAAVLVLIAATALYIELAPLPRYTPRRVRFEVDATPERVVRGRRVVTMLCAGCHKDPATGALTGRAMTDAPGRFGMIYSQNITQDRTYGIGEWTDALNLLVEHKIPTVVCFRRDDWKTLLHLPAATTEGRSK